MLCIQSMYTPCIYVHAAVPDDLVAIDRRPTYLVVGWTAPPSPFSGNYLLTYGPLGSMTYTMVEVTGPSYNITGLQPFTNYRVSVQARNSPVVEFGPPLSEELSTLPEARVLPEEEAPIIVLAQVGDGSSVMVEILIPPPSFNQSLLRYDKVFISTNVPY